MKIKEINEQMPSITEWMEEAEVGDVDEFRNEDNTKRDRLEKLNDILNIEYDRPEKMLATDILHTTKIFRDVLKDKGDERCALRLVPIHKNLPKLRIRGRSLRESLDWFGKQVINHADYKAEIYPHNDETLYSAIFLINNKGVFGEIIPGAHWQLTQGFLENEVTVFNYYNNKWSFTKSDPKMKDVVMRAIKSLEVEDKNIQRKLELELDAKFSPSGHLIGYFEFVVWPGPIISFIDYNRVLPNMLGDIELKLSEKNSNLSGVCASPGKASGKVKIALDSQGVQFEKGDILVCSMTTVDYVPLMKKASGIITEKGNILSHAAIVSREMKKPCIVGVKNVLNNLKNGDEIEMDASAGKITLKNR
jgi:phosphohistidine swiveling domain-containing protein